MHGYDLLQTKEKVGWSMSERNQTQASRVHSWWSHTLDSSSNEWWQVWNVANQWSFIEAWHQHFYWGMVMRAPSAWHISKLYIPRRKAGVQHQLHYLYSLGTVSLYQFWEWREPSWNPSSISTSNTSCFWANHFYLSVSSLLNSKLWLIISEIISNSPVTRISFI